MHAQAPAEANWSPRATLALSIGISAVFWAAFLVAFSAGAPYEQPVGWTQIEERDAAQAAVSSAMSNDAPVLTAVQDRTWLKPSEADFIGYACDDRSETGALNVAPKQRCP